MTNFVDFKLIKENISIEAVLNRYQVSLRRVNQRGLRGKCPLPTHSSKSSTESFAVDQVKNIWSCQSNSCVAARDGKKGGNLIDFVAIMEQCSIHDAALKLRDWFLCRNNEVVPEHRREKQKLVSGREEGNDHSDENRPLTFTLRGVDSNHVYLRSRGIELTTATNFGVGFFPGKGLMSGKVVIPIHNERGELVAYAGRCIDDSEPKYKMPAGFKKSLVLFNLHRVEGETLILVEGFFDCLKVWQSGILNVASLMGSSLSEQQEELLRRFKHIVLFLDGDDAGRGATNDIALRLLRSHFVRTVPLDAGKQPDQLSTEEIREALKDSV